MLLQRYFNCDFLWSLCALQCYILIWYFTLTLFGPDAPFLPVVDGMLKSKDCDDLYVAVILID